MNHDVLLGIQIRRSDEASRLGGDDIFLLMHQNFCHKALYPALDWFLSMDSAFLSMDKAQLESVGDRLRCEIHNS